MLTDETRYKILKLIQANPHMSQREVANQLGISLGKANFCLKALIEKGLIKASNFRNSKNKMAYAYKLTHKGMEEKARVTISFLRRKMQEYESLRSEIEQLRRETESNA